MLNSSEKEDLRKLLQKSIPELCASALIDHCPFTVEALIGITIGSEEAAFMINVKQYIENVEEVDDTEPHSEEDNGDVQCSAQSAALEGDQVKTEDENDENIVYIDNEADTEMTILVAPPEDDESIYLPEKIWKMLQSGQCKVENTPEGQLITAPASNNKLQVQPITSTGGNPQVQPITASTSTDGGQQEHPITNPESNNLPCELQAEVEMSSEISTSRVISESQIVNMTQNIDTIDHHQYSTQTDKKSQAQLKREYRSRKKMIENAHEIVIGDDQNAHKIVIGDDQNTTIVNDCNPENLMTIKSETLVEEVHSIENVTAIEETVVQLINDDEIPLENNSVERWKCDLCGKCLKSHRNLVIHMKGIHAPPQYTCQQCGENYPYQLPQNVCKVCRNPNLKHKSFKCLGCGSTFPKKFLLMKHKRESCSSNIQITNIDSYMDKIQVSINECSETFACVRCKAAFSTETDLKIHMKEQHPSSVKCSGCGIVFENFTLLKHHKKFCISVIKLEEKKPPKEFICETCGAIYSTRSRLKDHVMGMHLAPSFKCSCGLAFRWRSTLNKHKEKCRFSRPEDGKVRRISKPKLSETVYKCPYCDGIYKSDSGLRSHIQAKHKQSATFKCLLCNKCFVTRGALAKHRTNCPPKLKRKPTTKYVFKCKFCGKEFPVKGQLEKHIIGKHLKGKCYACSVCGKAFQWHSTLARHREICNKSGSEGNILDTFISAEVQQADCSSS